VLKWPLSGSTARLKDDFAMSLGSGAYDAAVVASPNDFIDVVARARGLLVTRTSSHVFRLESRGESPPWYCDLDDGTPTGESDPASSVRWVCPQLRAVRSPTEPVTTLLDVHRPGSHSDLARMVSWFGRLTGRRAVTPTSAGAESRYSYTDPYRIMDAELRHRAEHWPSALHGDGVVRPAELWSIQVSGEGLIVTSVSWWGSAPALDHQIALAVDVAGRLAAEQQNRPRP